MIQNLYIFKLLVIMHLGSLMSCQQSNKQTVVVEQPTQPPPVPKFWPPHEHIQPPVDSQLYPWNVLQVTHNID